MIAIITITYFYGIIFKIFIDFQQDYFSVDWSKLGKDTPLEEGLQSDWFIS